MNTVIAKWGNSFAVRIPKGVIDHAQLREGDRLDCDLTEEGVVVLRPVRRAPTLEELVNGITPENRPIETEWGCAQGNEAW